MMDRRKLIGTMAAFTATLAARAQVPGRVYRIGFLGSTSPQYDTPAETRIMNELVFRLRELGFSEGDNTVIERRFADGRNERYVDFAAEMVKLKVDTVVAGNVAGVRAVLSASRTMPIVTTTGDPVQAGFAASLAHPGGQVTGISNLGTVSCVTKTCRVRHHSLHFCRIVRARAGEGAPIRSWVTKREGLVTELADRAQTFAPRQQQSGNLEVTDRKAHPATATIHHIQEHY